MSSIHIAVLGHAKAGADLAGALSAAGAQVVGFDLKAPRKPTVEMAETIAEAVAGADVVLSLNSSSAALKMAKDAAPHMKAGALYADLNPATPRLKQMLAEIFEEDSFVDVAILNPDAVAEPLVMLAAGPNAQILIDLLAPFGLNLEFVSFEVGDAAARALTRSILTKCLAGVVVDYMWAADKMGLADWAYQELQREFDSIDAETAKTYLRESGRDVKRREIEMLDVVEMLESVDYHSLFVPPTQLVYNKVYHSIKVPFSEPHPDAE